MNYIKKYFSVAIIIENRKVYPYIMKDVASKGRYMDYCIRILIKNINNQLILIKKINHYIIPPKSTFYFTPIAPNAFVFQLEFGYI